jgi:hypothetical protein
MLVLNFFLAMAHLASTFVRDMRSWHGMVMIVMCNSKAFKRNDIASGIRKWKRHQCVYGLWAF